MKGDGDGIWPQVLDDVAAGRQERIYEGGRVPGASLHKARWDLMPRDRYMWASVQTVRGCPKHCSFCSVWRTDGQEPRQRTVDAVLEEIVQLRRMGFRFIALADDNFYPVTLEDLAMARRREDPSRLHELEALREERFELMERLAKLPRDTVFFTQITMEAAEDPAFLDAMRNARIRGALIGVEAVTEEGLKDVYKGFNLAGDALVNQLQRFREHGVHVLGSFIFGLPSDRPDSFEATAALAHAADIDFAQFLTLTPFPGTVDFLKWGEERSGRAARRGRRAGQPLLADSADQAAEDLLAAPGDDGRGDSGPAPSARGIASTPSARSGAARVASAPSATAWRSCWCPKLYRQMYGNTGIATDSARVSRSAAWARWLAIPLKRLFSAAPMPELQVPVR